MSTEKTNDDTELGCDALFAEVLGLLNQFECEPDEDSCAGAAFFTARLNEDSFYILKGKIEKIIQANAGGMGREGSRPDSD